MLTALRLSFPRSLRHTEQAEKRAKITIIGHNHIRSRPQQVVALDGIHAARAVDFVAGHTDGQGADRLGSENLGRAIADTGDLLTRQTMLGHQLLEDNLLAEG